MPRIARQTLLDRFRAKLATGQPLIGGGAGTGLSAKCEEAGGIDLIVIYNSGRYRMAGRGSLAGLMAYGNANQIVCEMAHEVLPVVKHTPVLAGVNGTDPFMIPEQFLQRLIGEYKAHAAFEEAEFLPLSETILSRNSNHMAALGMSLHMRHAKPVNAYI